MSDELTVRVTCDAVDYASAEWRTQVYVQLPDVARAAFLLPSSRFEALTDRAWPEVVDVAVEHFRQGWAFVHPDAVMAAEAVARWIEAPDHREEMQAAFEADHARRDPVARRLLTEVVTLRARLAELEAAQAPDGVYPPAMPWAALMDHGDLTDFLDELGAAAIANVSCEDALAEVEETCGRWRAIAEAQHAHNTAPGPDAITRLTVPVQVLREGEHYAATHHDYRVPRDLPDTTTPMGDPR